MNYRKRAMLLVLAVVVVVFGIDAYWIATDGYLATISYNFYSVSKENPVLPFLLGYIVSHLTWPNSSEAYKSAEKKDAETDAKIKI